MSSTTSGRLPDGTPAGRVQAEAHLDAVRRVVGRVPVGGLIDPLNVARQVGLDALATLAALHLLIATGIGGFVIRVVSRDGIEVGRFAAVRDIRPVIEDEFGEEFTVTPESVEIAFDPHARPASPRRVPRFLRSFTMGRR